MSSILETEKSTTAAIKRATLNKRRNSVGQIPDSQVHKNKAQQVHDEVISLEGMDLSPSSARRKSKKAKEEPSRKNSAATFLTKNSMRTSVFSSSSSKNSDSESEASSFGRSASVPRGYVSPFADVEIVRKKQEDGESGDEGKFVKSISTGSKTVKAPGETAQRKLVKHLFLNGSKKASKDKEKDNDLKSPSSDSGREMLTPTTPGSATESPHSAKSSITDEAERWGEDGTRRVLQSGTLNELVDSFIENIPDALTTKYLIFAHRQFVSSEALMKALHMGYEKILNSTRENELTASSKSLRFLNIFKIWIQLDGRNIAKDQRALKAFNTFLESLQSSNQPLHDHLKTLMESKIMSRSSGIIPDAIIPHPSGAKLDFLDCNLLQEDPDDFAQQLSLYEQRLIANIPIDEFYDTKWTKGKADNIAFAYDFVNKFSHALIYQILCHSRDEIKVAVLGKVISIGKALLSLQNFNSLLAVFLALQNTNVEKVLEEYKKSIAQKLLKFHREIATVMSPSHNFSHYRAALANITGSYIPCYEVHLKDLLYSSEGNPNWIDEDAGVLNLYKLDSMGKIISIFYQATRSAYEFGAKTDYKSLFDSVVHIKVDELQSSISNILRKEKESGSVKKSSGGARRVSNSFSNSESMSASTSSNVSSRQSIDSTGITSTAFDFASFDNIPQSGVERDEAVKAIIENLKNYAHLLHRKEKELNRRERELEDHFLDNSSVERPLLKANSKK